MRSAYEIKAQKALEKDGYQVDYKCRPHFTPRGYNTDYFGCFDLLAYPKAGWVFLEHGLISRRLRFIAIKGHEGIPSELRKKIKELQFPDGVTKEIWVFRKDKSIKREVIP